MEKMKRYEAYVYIIYEFEAENDLDACEKAYIYFGEDTHPAINVKIEEIKERKEIETY